MSSPGFIFKAVVVIGIFMAATGLFYYFAVELPAQEARVALEQEYKLAKIAEKKAQIEFRYNDCITATQNAGCLGR